MSVHVELATGTLHLSQPDGPHVEVLPMPYSVAIPG